MTREKAIKEYVIPALRHTWNEKINKKVLEAIEQEPILDKIKADIKEWYWQADKQELAKDPCVVDAMVDLFIRTIDKYKTESENKE